MNIGTSCFFIVLTRSVVNEGAFVKQNPVYMK